MDLEEIGVNAGNWVDSAEDRDYWKAFVNVALNLRVPYAIELKLVNINIDSIFQIMFKNDFARTLADDKVPGGTTWNQVTKKETVVEREKNRRSGQSLRSLS